MENQIYIAIVMLALGSLLSIEDQYFVGTGISDITGPPIDINFMGYANMKQNGEGIHLRLRSRAFVIGTSVNRVVFVSIDGGMGSDLVKQKVVEKIQSKLGDNVLYTIKNVCISATHTHSSPGGFLQYTLYQITSLGFVKETFDAIVDGIASSVLMAHENIQLGNIKMVTSELHGANINRSPTAYILNPLKEREIYSSDTDSNMLQIELRATNEQQSLLGVINWFAVHGTSLNSSNTLVSGDNKGYASYLLEKEYNLNIDGSIHFPGRGPLVAAFSSSNLGDVSPNTSGPKCEDSGKTCDGSASSCNGNIALCRASGPGLNGDMYDSNRIIGTLQYQKAKEMIETLHKKPIIGKIAYQHSFVKMPGLNVIHPITNTSIKLCSAALGYAFAAGTTDGPGQFNFFQGESKENFFWNLIRNVLSTPTNEQKKCHSPKPILINTGGASWPYPWQASILPLQLFRIGSLFIIGVPGELTTMAGRRLKSHLKSKFQELFIQYKRNDFWNDIKLNRRDNEKDEELEIEIVIAGLANSYSGYITTFEEYQAQRYEGASTLYGPHTLQGLLQEYGRLAEDMILQRESSSESPPPDNLHKQIEMAAKPLLDKLPSGGAVFGDVVTGNDVKSNYMAGKDIVTVSYHSSNPRHNIGRTGTDFSYLTVELLTPATVRSTASTTTASTLLPPMPLTIINSIQDDRIPMKTKKDKEKEKEKEVEKNEFPSQSDNNTGSGEPLVAEEMSWAIVAVDGDADTKIRWSPFASKSSSSSSLVVTPSEPTSAATFFTPTIWSSLWSTTSEKHLIATVTWEIPASAVVGKYRICHTGVAKTKTTLFSGGIKSYRGCSSLFEVRNIQ